MRYGALLALLSLWDFSSTLPRSYIRSYNDLRHVTAQYKSSRLLLYRDTDFPLMERCYVFENLYSL